jgi:hypothetical protein
MSFVGSLLLLAGIISAVYVPVYFGRGLSEGSGTRLLMSLGFAVLTAVLFFILRRGQGDGARAED